MTIHAPAKVNLTLHILGKRLDGFHNIETLMAPISLSDEIEIVVSNGEGVELICDDPATPVDETNLAWRAARAFAIHTGTKFHTRIGLKKNIPLGAGLGGGSSDAASVLLALDTLLSTRLSTPQLESIAATLGSDVSFFVRRRPALCRGRGELIEDTGPIPSRPLLLVTPPFPVSTAWAYQTWTASPARGPSQFLSNIKLINDLEDNVFKKYVLLPVIKNWLREQPEIESAMMTGSGSTIFAVLYKTSNSLAERIRDHFGPHMWIRFCELENGT